MKKCSPLELLTTIALRDADSKKAAHAFDEFCKRYGERLVKVCILVCKHYKLVEFEEVAKDICQDTLIKVYLNADQFKQQDQTANSAENDLFKWMSKIASNELRMFLRKKTGVLLSDEEWSGIEEPNDVPVDSKRKIKLELIEKAIKSLSCRDSEIVRTALSHPKYMDRQDVTRLSETFGIAKATVRQIKKRSLAEIKQIVLDMYRQL